VLKAGDQIRLCDRQFIFIAGQAAGEANGVTHADS
jgi:hypothetical protein